MVEAHDYGGLLVVPGIAALVLLSTPLFAALRETLGDVFESAPTESTLVVSLARRATALVVWIAFVSALGASLVLPTAAEAGALASIFVTLVVAYRILPPSPLGAGDALQAALVASVRSPCSWARCGGSPRRSFQPARSPRLASCSQRC